MDYLPQFTLEWFVKCVQYHNLLLVLSFLLIFHTDDGLSVSRNV